jgi:hypothetical protein
MHQLESFFWGIIAALGALVVEFVAYISISAYVNQTSLMAFSQLFAVPQFIVLFAFIEEFFKYIVISRRIEMLSLEKSYLVNSFLLGLGFFGIELSFISMSMALPDWKVLAEIAILHIGTAGLIGYNVATKNPKKIFTFIYILSVAVFFHSIYNFLVIKREFWQNYGVFVLLGLLILINAFNFSRISRKLAQD